MTTGDRYPPPPARRVSPLRVVLASVLLGLVLCAGGGLLLALPVLDQYPAAVSTPAELVGMHQLTDPRLNQIGTEMLGGLRSDAGLTATVGAFYLPTGAPATKAVFVAGGTGLNLDLTGPAHRMFTRMRRDGATVTGEAPVDPGPMGGSARCASATSRDLPVPVGVCIWIDYGSFGVVLAFDRTVADTANLMVLVRPEVLHRG
jgi:hypothetical protein